MSLIFGYNTNGFAHHRLADAVANLAELGYRAVGITLDYGHLDPYASDLRRQVATLARQLRHAGMKCVVETGARFLLDSRRKHHPTMLSDDAGERGRRMDFLLRSLSIASDLGADAVSLWSGKATSVETDAVLFDRLCRELDALLVHAERFRMPLAFEPEPGMFIDTLASATPMFDRLPHPLLQLTMDIGHLHCQREGSIPDLIETWSSKLANVHIEDMRAGRHDHLMFGEGEIDFPPALRQLEKIGYSKGVYVELSRHSNDAVEIARQAFEFLKSS